MTKSYSTTSINSSTRATAGWKAGMPDTKEGTVISGIRSMSRLALPVLALAACTALGGFVLAQDAEPVTSELTPRLQDLLRQEMLSIDDASRQILAALVRGDNATVAGLAQRIHDSFILRQSMTPEDKADLIAAVPEDFVRQDKAFHQISATLAQAARDGDRTQQHEKFSRMIEACSACHAQYATDRFPNFAE